MATNNETKLPVLSERTAKMLSLIHEIGNVHDKLLALYAEVYYETDCDNISDALYKLQDLWLERTYGNIRENFWAKENEL